MKRESITQYSIRSVFSVTVVGAFVAHQYIPKDVSAKIRLASVDAANQRATFEISNSAKNEIWFYGYSSDSPFYSISGKLAQGSWQSMGPGWCCTGAGMQRLDKTATMQFDVCWWDKTIDTIQIEVLCHNTSNANALSVLVQSQSVDLQNSPTQANTLVANQH